MARVLLVIIFLGALMNNVHAQDEEFVSPKTPLNVELAPSPKVTNGHLFESGSLRLPEESELILPSISVVEEYEGESVQFFLTKTMHCVGHPPTSMKLFDARGYFGLAFKVDEDDYTLSTFGEWQNRGGSAQVKLLVLMPRGQGFRKSEGLSGPDSEAATELDLDNPALETCYWYAGIEPADGWERIETDIHFNRFVAPK